MSREAQPAGSVSSELDEQGWSSLWFGEAFGREVFTAAALLLSASQRLRIGTGIANSYGRDAVTCAAAARTLRPATGPREPCPLRWFPRTLPLPRERLGAGARLVVVQAVVVTPGIDADEWRRRAHQHLEVYTGLPNYLASWRRQGFSDDDLVQGGSDRLKQAMVPFGVDATLQRIENHRGAGTDEVLVQVLGEHPLTPTRAEWALLAGELR